MKKEKISAYQYFWLSTNMLISTIILLIPKIIIQDGREYAWIVPIVSGSAIAIINYLVLILGCNFSNNIIISDLKNILGPILGRILLIPYIFIIIHTTSMMMYQGVQFASFVMPSKSEIGFWIMIALLGSYLSYKGIETIARLAQIGVIIISIAVITILIGSYNSITIKWLKPFAINYKKVIRASITPAHWFLIIPNLSLILKPYFKNNKKSIKASLLGNFMGQIITVILFINALTVLGADLTSILKFPFYTLSSLALAGLEVIIFIAWIMGVIIEVGIFYFSSLQLISSFFELKDYRILIPPFLIMITSLGIFQTNIPMSLTKIGYIVPINVLLLEIPFLIIFTLIYLAASKTDKLSKQ
ncbi:GerAB/ArcD/ProY family transporter [Orenia marismortui]|uniref:GerAB/ArcD/ProY family transporter n=1 Tax=Orenia marismortui TaxID=46469 RepID=UPI00035D031D|nr:GerAB/ArcD/ProY family transporter [Orenia marismortui]